MEICSSCIDSYFLNLSRHSRFSPQAADLDGEIDLSACYDVTEHPVQRNYGFQIHVSLGQSSETGMVWRWEA